MLEKLLRPRVMIMCNYPGSKFKLKDILGLIGNEYYNTMGLGKLSKAIVEECPEIFHSLEWYQFRNEIDMPMYLKGDDGVFKVITHFTGLDKDHVKCFNGVIDTREHYMNLVPATSVEYQNNLKKIC